MTDLRQAQAIADLWKYELRAGASLDTSAGACLLDAVSWFEYGHLGDAPACVCPTLRSLGIGINDVLADRPRQRLKPYIARMAHTVDDAALMARVEFLVDQAVNVFLPTLFHRLRPAHCWSGPAFWHGVLADLDAMRALLRGMQARDGIGAILPDEEWEAVELAHDAVRSLISVQEAFASDPSEWPSAFDLGHAFSRACGSSVAVIVKVAGTMEEPADALLTVLDGLLAIGKHGDGWPEEEARAAVQAFEDARRAAGVVPPSGFWLGLKKLGKPIHSLLSF